MAKPTKAKGVWAPLAAKAIQFKVTLRDIEPPIWRRLVLPDNFTLVDLHVAIQIAMGWEDDHLHSFQIGEVSYTDDRAGDVADMDMEDEAGVLLSRMATGTPQKFLYEYDFGDSWQHAILVEELLPPDAATTHPVCLAGARACPPEDCGGFPGYDTILRALKARKKSDDQMELLEWVGEEFDPERFDLEAVNRRLKTVWKRAARRTTRAVTP